MFSMLICALFGALLIGADAAFSDCQITLYSQKDYKGKSATWEARIQASPRGTLANAYLTGYLEELGQVRSYDLKCRVSPNQYSGYILHKTFFRFYKDWKFNPSPSAQEGSYRREPYIAGPWPDWRYYNMDSDCESFESFALYFNPWGSLKVSQAFPMKRVVEDEDAARRKLQGVQPIGWKRVKGGVASAVDHTVAKGRRTLARVAQLRGSQPWSQALL